MVGSGKVRHAHTPAVAPDRRVLPAVERDVIHGERVAIVGQPDVDHRPAAGLQRKARQQACARGSQRRGIEPGEQRGVRGVPIGGGRCAMNGPFQTRHVGKIGQGSQRLEIIEEAGEARAMAVQVAVARRFDIAESSRQCVEVIFAGDLHAHRIGQAQGGRDIGHRVAAIDREQRTRTLRIAAQQRQHGLLSG